MPDLARHSCWPACDGLKKIWVKVRAKSWAKSFETATMFEYSAMKKH